MIQSLRTIFAITRAINAAGVTLVTTLTCSDVEIHVSIIHYELQLAFQSFVKRSKVVQLREIFRRRYGHRTFSITFHDTYVSCSVTKFRHFHTSVIVRKFDRIRRTFYSNNSGFYLALIEISWFHLRFVRAMLLFLFFHNEQRTTFTRYLPSTGDCFTQLH